MKNIYSLVIILICTVCLTGFVRAEAGTVEYQECKNKLGKYSSAYIRIIQKKKNLEKQLQDTKSELQEQVTRNDYLKAKTISFQEFLNLIFNGQFKEEVLQLDWGFLFKFTVVYLKFLFFYLPACLIIIMFPLMITWALLREAFEALGK